MPIDLPGSPPGIHIRSARLSFGGRPIFDGLDLDLPAGSWTCLLGPSGVGKTTLLRLIAGLATPEPPTQIGTDDGQPLKGRYAWMGQQDLLLPWATVLDNVMLGARLRSERPDRAHAMDLLAQVGLADRAGSRPVQLSGGMRQRVALARTLMENRPAILMDEPFSALDALTRLKLQDLAARLLRGRTVLLVTHDPMEALRLADRVLVLHGQPARFMDPIDPPATAPRAPDDPGLLAIQGRLLLSLAGVAA